ncbi:hypothetical protein N7G274_008447 [Stereocaulon virgatum]|uniref:Profilin n=1 Tax=Stereocaulon virgatum TaxID=373712 RepID=A0ABR4A1Q3_9LECA
MDKPPPPPLLPPRLAPCPLGLFPYKFDPKFFVLVGRSQGYLTFSIFQPPLSGSVRYIISTWLSASLQTSCSCLNPLRIHLPLSDFHPAQGRMSWQAYIDTSLVGSRNVDKAAIFNVEGTSVWASSPNFKLEPAEIKAVLASYAEKEPKPIFETGFKVAGEKYFTLKADDRSVYGKKGREGMIIVKTKQALLIAHYPEDVQPGAASLTVEKLGDYLIGLGY